MQSSVALRGIGRSAGTRATYTTAALHVLRFNGTVSLNEKQSLQLQLAFNLNIPVIGMP